MKEAPRAHPIQLNRIDDLVYEQLPLDPDDPASVGYVSGYTKHPPMIFRGKIRLYHKRHESAVLQKALMEDKVVVAQDGIVIGLLRLDSFDHPTTSWDSQYQGIHDVTMANVKGHFWRHPDTKEQIGPSPFDRTGVPYPPPEPPKFPEKRDQIEAIELDGLSWPDE